MHFMVFPVLVLKSEIRESNEKKRGMGNSVLSGSLEWFKFLQCVVHLRATWLLLLLFSEKMTFSCKSLFSAVMRAQIQAPFPSPFSQSTWKHLQKENQSLLWSLKPSANPSTIKLLLKMSGTFHHFWRRAFGCFEKVFTAHWGGPGVWVTAAKLSVSVGVWKCVQALVWFCCVYMCVCGCVCGPVQNKSGHSSAELACAQHIRSRKERQAFIFAHACREPNGDHMPESGKESFCVINTKSLGVPHCQGLRCSSRAPIRGSVEANEIPLRHR